MEHRLTDIPTFSQSPLHHLQVFFGGEDFASAVEILVDGNRSAMNSDDFMKIDAVSYVVTLQAMSTYFLSVIWN